MEKEMAEYLTQKTQSVYDHEFYIKLQEVPLSEWMAKPSPLHCKDDYLEKINSLIITCKENSIEGLNRFKKRDLIFGTTQSFDEAYLRYCERRLRIYRGEYAYHKRVMEDFVFVEDEEIQKHDFLIVSLPFCSTGSIPEGGWINFEKTLDRCLALGVPVEVDCAYFGTCYGLEFNFNHPAIKAVSFSLSKGMGLGDIRSGIRYSNYEDSMPIRQQNLYNHLPLLNAKVGIFMMETFNFDYLPMTYKAIQQEVCAKLNIEATPCVHLALGNSKDHEDFIIDGSYYRLGLRDILKLKKKGKL